MRTPYAASELLGRITLYMGFILCNACGKRVEIVWRFITSRTGSIAVVPTMHASVAERACAAPVTRLLGDGGKGCRPLRRAGGNLSTHQSAMDSRSARPHRCADRIRSDLDC